MNQPPKPIILGITPARGGSKGIPKKNIRCMAGKPLLAWTIEAAQKARLLDHYLVSTENSAIAAVARQFHAEVLKRPVRLAADTTSTVCVLQHVLRHYPCDIVVLLQATSPVRRNGLIDACIKEFLKKGYDSLATGFLCKYVAYGKNSRRRQDIKGFFTDDGNIYVLKAGLIKKGKLFGGKIGRKIISRTENIDIDDPFDFFVAEQILKQGGSLCRS